MADLHVEPNPIDRIAAVALVLPRAGELVVTVFNEFGRQVAEVVSGRFPAGRHTISWSIGDIPAGTYYCQMQLGAESTIRKICVVR